MKDGEIKIQGGVAACHGAAVSGYLRRSKGEEEDGAPASNLQQAINMSSGADSIYCAAFKKLLTIRDGENGAQDK